MRSLVKNTAINFVAFGLVSVVSILIIPVIIAHYGMDKFGLLVLVRLMLPTGLIGIFDLGLPEATTRYVASARAESDMSKAGGIVMQNLCMAACIGLLVAVAIGLAAPTIVASWLRLEAATAASFYPIVLVTAAALILQFPGMIAEAALKGLQRFEIVRLGEVAVVALYAVGTIAAIKLDYGYQVLAYLFLGLASTKLVLFGAVLIATRQGIKLSIGTGGWPALKDTLSLARHIWFGKLLSHSSQSAPQLLIANLAGPAALGTYDVLIRLPRFAKAVYSLSNSALLPTSAGLETHQADGQLRQVLLIGTTFSLAVFMPPIIGASVYSADILRVWLGPEFESLGPWLALFFGWTLITAVYALGTSMLVARREAVRKGNRIVLLELIFNFCVAFLAFEHFQEKAFILSITLSAALALPFKIGLICREYTLTYREYVAVLGRLAAASAAAALWWIVADWTFERDGPVGLILAFSGWCMTYWLAIYTLAFSTEDRRHAQKIMGSLAPLLQFNR